MQPWLEQTARTEHVLASSLWMAMQQESEARLRQGRPAAAYDWQDIARKALGLWLPDPAPAPRQAVLALVYPDVWDFLVWLHQAGLPAALVTNGWAKNQRPYLASLGWEPLFPLMVGAESGWAKPDPRIFSLVPSLGMHIGDRAAHDVLGARRAGIRSVHLIRQAEPAGGGDVLSPSSALPDFTATSLQQVPELLRRWQKG